MKKYVDIYNNRWKISKGTPDQDILIFKSPNTQVSFFYLHYNLFISKIIKKNFDNLSGIKLLEFGCGRATSSIYQAKINKILIQPTDYSDAAIDIANNNLIKYGLKPNAIVADIYDMPFDDESFDIILSLGVMEHLENIDAAYFQIKRLLKPGGILISMNVPEKPANIQRIANPINKIMFSFRNFLGLTDYKSWLDKNSRSKTGDVYRTYMTSSIFVNKTIEAGFNSVDCFEINPFPTFDPVPKMLDFLITKIYTLILQLRKIIKISPFSSSERNSRVHFIVAKK